MENEKKIDFVGKPDAALAAEQVVEKVEELNRALEHAARLGIGMHVCMAFAAYENPSLEVPQKIVVSIPAMLQSKRIYPA